MSSLQKLNQNNFLHSLHFWIIKHSLFLTLHAATLQLTALLNCCSIAMLEWLALPVLRQGVPVSSRELRPALAGHHSSRVVHIHCNSLEVCTCRVKKKRHKSKCRLPDNISLDVLWKIVFSLQLLYLSQLYTTGKNVMLTYLLFQDEQPINWRWTWTRNKFAHVSIKFLFNEFPTVILNQMIQNKWIKK